MWADASGWSGVVRQNADLVFAFGAPEAIGDDDRYREISGAYPGAQIVGCSTAGEIHGTSLLEGSLVTTAIRLERSRASVAAVALEGDDVGRSAARLAAALDAPDLAHVFVLSDGLHVNGTRLAEGLVRALPPTVAVTGGLAGDADRFRRTLVIADGLARDRTVVGVGLYGTSLRVGYGSVGGWDPFGPERRVTRSEGSVVYEFDGYRALDLYKRYLGDHAGGLPATGLLFPIQLRSDGRSPGPVRTILGVDQGAGTLTFAGTVPEGSLARLMKANFDRLIDGAHTAASRSIQTLRQPAELALLVSCVGRKLVLRQRAEEELDNVREVVGATPVLAGFYSYGELCPVAPGANCELHNQTMTITTLSEVPCTGS